MQGQELLNYGKYITSLISSAILNTAVPEPFDGMDWKKLFYLAKKHSVTVMIYPVVKDMALPAEVKELFVKDKNRMVARIARQNIEAERVFAALEKNSIKYIKLKGSHIKDMYPLDYMRTFGDIDICLTPEDREKAKPVMAELGYTLENSIGYHDEYIKDKFYIMELHSDVVNYVMRYAPIFTDPFSKAVPCSESGMGYVLKNEYLYLHLLCHLYNHFIKTGCGIRLFADFLVFAEKLHDVDYSFIKAQLKKYDMLDFYYTVERLNQYFFYDKGGDEKLIPIALYILESEPNGIYKYTAANLGFWGKVKYFLKNWFPSAKNMSSRYPILKKAPVLLPVCWIRRVFYTLFFKRSAIKTQVKSVKEINSSKYKNIKEVRRMAEEKH